MQYGSVLSVYLDKVHRSQCEVEILSIGIVGIPCNYHEHNTYESYDVVRILQLLSPRASRSMSVKVVLVLVVVLVVLVVGTHSKNRKFQLVRLKQRYRWHY